VFLDRDGEAEQLQDLPHRGFGLGGHGSEG
jgi:hypothetical protein